MTKIYGRFDGVVQIDTGKKHRKIYCADCNVRIWFKDGTVVLVGYPKDGMDIWFIRIEKCGRASHTLQHCHNRDDENNSDVLCINSPVLDYELVERIATTKKKDDTGMTLDEYQFAAQRTAQITNNTRDKIINGCMGLNGEAGECIDLLKKHLYQGHPLDKEKLMDECSDVLWYVAELAAGLGYSLEEVARHNIGKLKKRYPDGFDPERSIHRKE